MVRTTEEARELAAKRKDPGRKRKIAEDTRNAIMDKVMPLPDAFAELADLAKNARKPEVKLAALTLWIEQRCGKAKQTVDMDATVSQGEYVIDVSEAKAEVERAASGAAEGGAE